MKRKLRFLLVVVMTGVLAGTQAYGQRKPRIKGSRSPITVNQDLPDFRFLKLADDLEVEVRNGAPGYELEVDDNLVDVLSFQVQDSTLEITSFYQISSSKALKIIVYAQGLNAVEANAGRVFSEQPITTDLLSARASDNAKLGLHVRAGWVDLALSDNSSADLRIEADTLSMSLGGRTDTRVYANAGGLSAALSENASLSLEGVGAQVRFQAADNSSIKASRMQAQELSARLEGAATSRVFASETARLDLSGQARLYLYGEPALNITRFSDRAELHKEPE